VRVEAQKPVADQMLGSARRKHDGHILVRVDERLPAEDVSAAKDRS